MKKLFIFAALLFSLSAQAQTDNVVFKVGSAGYVTIDNQDYERGYITYWWALSGTDTVVGLAREYNTSQPFRSKRVITKFKDGDNASAAFASFAAWQTWWRANGAPKPDTIVSGGGAEILSGVSDPLSGNFVIVTCATCTTSSIIGIAPKYDAAFSGVAVGSFMVRPLTGSFRIYQTNNDGLADGLTFMWYLIAP